MRILKRLLAVLLFGWVVLAVTGADATESTVYIKSLTVDQVAPHRLGYKVWYRTSSGEQNITYIPISWFYGTAGKAQIISDWNSSSPYLEVFYKDNTFWYVRLHVVPASGDPSWTVVRNNENIDDQFNIDTLKIKY
jgi:hypothetical protein